MKLFRKKPLKLCINCKHIRGKTPEATCAAFPDLVTGEAVLYCRHAREFNALYCSAKAKFFEPKESL